MSTAAKDAYLRRYFREVERKYGITEDEWRAIFKAQGGADPICGRRFSMKIGGAHGGRMPSVDHNHFTGEVRGLLCGGSHDPKTCNRMIGFHRDNPLVFQRAADYLIEPPARAVLLAVRQGRIEAA